MRLLSAACLCLLLAFTAPSAESDAVIRVALQEILTEKKRLPGSLDVFGKATRVEVVGVSDAGLKALVMKTEIDIPWKDVTPAQLAAIVSDGANKPAQKLALLRYCATNQMSERATKLSIEIIEADSTLQEAVADALKGLKVPERPEPKPADSAATAKAMAAIVAPGTPAAPQRPKLPPIPRVIHWDTPEADAILRATQIFPPDNAWNEDISKRPVHPNSDKIIRNIGADTPLHVDVSENFVIVGPNQKKVDVKITAFPKLADPGPYPMPDNAPIQGWGLNKKVSLDEFQRKGEGDRHILVLDPHNQKLYEFYHCHKTDSGWTAAAQATFDLTSNKTRPKNWISADASGMAMFPGIIKYHELEQGEIRHAIRMTVSKTRKAFIYPATHLYAGHTDDPHYPAMGERFRLKASVDISKLPKQAQAIAVALKKYGAIVADNGRDWDLCATPDSRIDYEQMRAIFKNLKGSDLEVIVTTGENESPRAP